MLLDVFLLEAFFLATNSQKIRFPSVPLGITVGNDVSAGIF
jgi:hypothetical protein